MRGWLRLDLRQTSFGVQAACKLLQTFLTFRYLSMDATDLDDTECEQDALADLVDFEATPEEVLNRIEHCISAFLDELSCGRLQSIQTASGVLSI